MNHQFGHGMWNSMGGHPMMGQPMMGQPMMGQPMMGFIGDMNVKLIRGLNIFAMQDQIVIKKLKRNHTLSYHSVKTDLNQKQSGQQFHVAQ
jgi:hypothetical protein